MRLAPYLAFMALLGPAAFGDAPQPAAERATTNRVYHSE